MQRPSILTPILLASAAFASARSLADDKPRVLITTDGEIDDECSMVRFLLYANEFDIEGIITSSSQYHSHGHKWAGDDAATATDPDGDELTLRWWHYGQADSATASVTIGSNNSADEASFVAPNEAGKQIHIILEVTDDGSPPLVGYQRIVCHIN